MNRYVALSCLVLFFLLSCGQSGPLYLPDSSTHPNKNEMVKSQ